MEVNSNGGGRLPKQHVWLCLLLAALFLYNPFVTAPSSSFGLNVQQSASNRATVGASELQHFRASEAHNPEILTEEPAYELLVVDSSAQELFAAPDLRVRLPNSVFAGSWWFRPPPVA